MSRNLPRRQARDYAEQSAQRAITAVSSVLDGAVHAKAEPATSLAYLRASGMTEQQVVTGMVKAVITR